MDWFDGLTWWLAQFDKVSYKLSLKSRGVMKKTTQADVEGDCQISLSYWEGTCDMKNVLS